MANAKLLGPRTFVVGRYQCEMRFDDNGFRCEWTPHVPNALTPADVKVYRAHRDAFFKEVEKVLGIPIVTITHIKDGRK